MDIARNQQADEVDDGANNRRHGRVAPGTARCNLGKILDLSASGMRLRTRKSLTGEHIVQIKGNENMIRVLGRVVWSKKLGFRAYEIGLRFVDLPEEAAVLIRRIAAI
ncbi:MAG: PilZ domain-containing protein [Planctomycetota bacterium]|jgi:hypothetical protein